MVNFNMPSFDPSDKGEDKEEQVDLFKDAGVEVPSNTSYRESKKEREKQYYESIHKTIPITIQYFDLDDST